MTHIVHVVKGLNDAGSGRSLCAIAKHLQRLGEFRHTVVSLLAANESGARLAAEAGVRVLEAPRRETLLRELEGADIVQVEWWNNPLIYDFLRSDLPPMRLAIFIHVAGDTRPNILTRTLVDFADVCIAGCPYTYQHPAIQGLPESVRAKKTAMVFATADFSRVAGVEQCPHSGFNVGYIGSADFKKMHPDYIAMNAGARVPDIQFIVCGRGHLDILKQQAERLSAADKFQFRGYVQDLRPVLEILDVYGYPLCDNPGAELNIQEAMRAGVAPVVFGLGGLNDSVIHEKTGIVVKTPAEYTEALEYLYHHPGERRRLGEAARRFASETFGGENSAPKIKIVYENLLAQPKRNRRWKYFDVSSQRADGAWHFIESLSGEGGAFRRSFEARTIDDALEAEKQIVHSTPRELFGLEDYTTHFSESSHLQLWTALARFGLGRFEEARVSFGKAFGLGLEHWRLHWYQALCCRAMKLNVEARLFCLRTRNEAPEFEPAHELLDLLDEMDVRFPLQSTPQSHMESR
jgi:glycosyltransferase involved in cell wall biosynthesis